MSPRSRLIALACGLGFIACIILMGLRIGAEFKANPRPFYIFQEIAASRFEFAARPVVFEDYDEASPSGPIPHVRMTWGAAGDGGQSPDLQTLDLLAAHPSKHKDLPGLTRHEAWLRVLRLMDSTGRSPEETILAAQRGDVADRLIIVTKSLRPGFNPDTWGELHRTDWIFDFHELMPARGDTPNRGSGASPGVGGAGNVGDVRDTGTTATSPAIRHERLHYPTTKRGQAPKPDELKEGSWQYLAALYLMPKGGPKLTFARSPIAAAGWTLPAAAACGLGLFAAVIVGYRPRPTPPPPA